MVLINDQECSVCFESYSRSERIPRVLFCNHTFCDPCLETMAQQKKDTLTVRCPVCRQVSVVQNSLTLQDALRVNHHLWECLMLDQEIEKETSWRSPEAQAKLQCSVRPSSKQDRVRLRLPGFVKKMVSRQPQESIVPGCNVQMKSWRSLKGEERA